MLARPHAGEADRSCMTTFAARNLDARRADAPVGIPATSSGRFDGMDLDDRVGLRRARDGLRRRGRQPEGRGAAEGRG